MCAVGILVFGVKFNQDRIPSAQEMVADWWMARYKASLKKFKDVDPMIIR